MKIFINRKQVGVLNGNIYTRDKVRKSKHLLRTKDAWGIQEDLLDKLPRGCIIKIREIEDGIEYETTKEEFIEKGEWEQFGKNGAQIFLAREHFKKRDLTFKPIPV